MDGRSWTRSMRLRIRSTSGSRRFFRREKVLCGRWLERRARRGCGIPVKTTRTRMRRWIGRNSSRKSKVGSRKGNEGFKARALGKRVAGTAQHIEKCAGFRVVGLDDEQLLEGVGGLPIIA